MASPSRSVCGRCRRSSQVVDGLDDLSVDLDIGPAYGETFGAGALYADAQDGGDARAGMGAVDRDMDGQFETHVEAQGSAGDDQLEHALLVLDIKSTVFALCMGQVQQIS